MNLLKALDLLFLKKRHISMPGVFTLDLSEIKKKELEKTTEFLNSLECEFSITKVKRNE